MIHKSLTLLLTLFLPFFCLSQTGQRILLESTDGQKLEWGLGETPPANDWQVDYQKTPLPNGGYRLQLSITPKGELGIKSAKIGYTLPYSIADKVFCNGFQSWTETREFGVKERIKHPRKLLFNFYHHAGDYDFARYSKKKGQLHSWDYTYVRHPGGGLWFWGSLAENTGYTVFYHDTQQQALSIEKECEGMVAKGKTVLFDLVFLKGDEKAVFDRFFGMFFEKFPRSASLPEPGMGWTSWYQYYTKINEKIILENLSACNNCCSGDLKACTPRPNFLFQIDDGWQTFTGDWTSVDKVLFPNGLKTISDSAHQAGLQAGLWLAPFVAEKKSALVREHPEWFLHEKNGKMMGVAFNPMWSGWYYALDIYHPEVRAHLKKTFDTILREWGFDLVKLDFLYAAGMVPRDGKTRGQIMDDAMALLRECVGPDKLILGCGVPLAAAWGKVDYCRIGADVHLAWEHKPMQFLRARERVSTRFSLQNTLYRHHLDGRAFANDPDVILLRDARNKLSPQQRITVFYPFALLGGLVLCSDNFSQWTGSQRQTYSQLPDLMRKTQVIGIYHGDGGRFDIDYILDGARKRFSGNWETGKQ